MRALAAHLAALILALVLAAPDAHAQAGDRGYGGPATVGPNFSTGKQSEAPDYGSGGAKKPAYKKPSAAKASAPKKSKSAARPAKSKPATRSAAKPVKPSKSQATAKTKTEPKSDEPKSTAAGDAKTASEPPAETAAPASSETAPATGEPTSATTSAKPETCRRFDATTAPPSKSPASSPTRACAVWAQHQAPLAPAQCGPSITPHTPQPASRASPLPRARERVEVRGQHPHSARIPLATFQRVPTYGVSAISQSTAPHPNPLPIEADGRGRSAPPSGAHISPPPCGEGPGVGSQKPREKLSPTSTRMRHLRPGTPAAIASPECHAQEISSTRR